MERRSYDPVRQADALLRKSRKLLAQARAAKVSADVTCQLRAERIRAETKRRGGSHG